MRLGESRSNIKNNSKISAWNTYQQMTKKMWFNEECKAVQEEKDKAQMKVLQNLNEINKKVTGAKAKKYKKGN